MDFYIFIFLILCILFGSLECEIIFSKNLISKSKLYYEIKNLEEVECVDVVKNTITNVATTTGILAAIFSGGLAVPLLAAIASGFSSYADNFSSKMCGLFDRKMSELDYKIYTYSLIKLILDPSSCIKITQNVDEKKLKEDCIKPTMDKVIEALKSTYAIENCDKPDFLSTNKFTDKLDCSKYIVNLNDDIKNLDISFGVVFKSTRRKHIIKETWNLISNNKETMLLFQTVATSIQTLSNDNDAIKADVEKLKNSVDDLSKKVEKFSQDILEENKRSFKLELYTEFLFQCIITVFAANILKEDEGYKNQSKDLYKWMDDNKIEEVLNVHF